MTDTEHPDTLPYFREALQVAGISRNPEGGTLYHYTSAEGLCGIVGTGTVWATHANFLNDTSEQSYGQSLLLGALDRLNSAGLESVREALEPMLRSGTGHDVYAACFCESDDLLPQWRGYGAAGSGYAIGFPSSALSREGAEALLPVAYGDEAVLSRYNRLLDWAVQKLRALRSDPGADSSSFVDILTSLATSLFLCTAASKKAVFEYEREWRLVCLLDTESSEEHDTIQLRIVSGMVTPYLCLELPRTSDGGLNVASIRCGPTLRDDSVRAGVHFLLAKHRLTHTAVLNSEAPVRR